MSALKGLAEVFRDRKSRILWDLYNNKLKLKNAAGVEKVLDVASLALMTASGAGLKVQSAHVTVTDDGAAVITPVASVGVILLFSFDATNAANFIVASFKAGTSPYMTKIAATATIADVGVTHLVGTTGTDTHFALAANADGTIDLENRLGASRNFSYIVIGE